MARSSSSSSGGVGFFSLLAILFIGLKLSGHITWSWVWVLSPIWGCWIFLALVVAVAFLMS